MLFISFLMNPCANCLIGARIQFNNQQIISKIATFSTNQELKYITNRYVCGFKLFFFIL
jgi:hypothetical protein